MPAKYAGRICGKIHASFYENSMVYLFLRQVFILEVWRHDLY